MNRKTIPVNDWGLLLGYGLFETLRLYDSHPFLLTPHLDRLTASAKALHFPYQPEQAEMTGLLTDYIRDSRLTDEAVRISLTYGQGPTGKDAQLFFTHRPVPYGAADYKKGIAVSISPYKKNQFSPIVDHKTFNQMENVVSLRNSASQGAKECVFLNTVGYLAEGSKSNLFFIKKGVLYTPAKECGILPGITRQRVIDIARQQGLEVVEGRFKAIQLRDCDECFCTNSLMEIMPVVQLDGRPLGSGKPGEITIRLAPLYRQ
ncbi:MAG: aminotransferase class IV [bacterium]|nr:aminotransferase class IV [bacterium]